MNGNNVHFLTAACKQVSLETTKPTSDVIFENLDLILANVVTLQRKLNVISCTDQGSHSDDGFVLELNLLALVQIPTIVPLNRILRGIYQSFTRWNYRIPYRILFIRNRMKWKFGIHPFVKSFVHPLIGFLSCTEMVPKGVL